MAKTALEIAQKLVNTASLAAARSRISEELYAAVHNEVSAMLTDQSTAYEVAASLKRLGYDHGGRAHHPHLQDISSDENLEQLNKKIAMTLCVNACPYFPHW